MQQQAFVLDSRLAPHVLARDRVTNGRRIGNGSRRVAFTATLDGAPVCLKTSYMLLPAMMDEFGIERGSVEHANELSSLQGEALRFVDVQDCRQADNIVSFRGVLLDDDGCLQYIVTELCAGGSMSRFVTQYMAEHGCVEPWLLLSWLVDSGLGLSDLHSIDGRGVVHRDLKPESYMVRLQADGSAVVVLGELGESKALSSRHPVAATSVGNPFTLAPEVLSGRGYGTHADVYAWALTVLTFVLQCTMSADDEARLEYLRASILVYEGLPRLGRLDERLVELLRRCTAVEWPERPTMTEVVQQLLIGARDKLNARAAAGVATALEWLVRLLLSKVLSLL